MVIPTRPTYHHGDLRNSLIQAALALVAERGVEGFSLREAARMVGVSPSACYRHFADREELLAAVAHEGLDALAEEMRVAAAPHEGPSAFDAVHRFWDYSGAYLHFALAHPAHFRVMHVDPEVRAQPRPDAAAQPGGARAGRDGRARRRPASSRPRPRAARCSPAGRRSTDSPAGRRRASCRSSDELTLEAALDAVLRTAMLGAGVEPALLPPEHPLPGGVCPGLAELVRDAP